MSRIMDMTRETCHCLLDGNDEIFEQLIGSISKRDLDKSRVDFLSTYITFIMGTKIVSDTTKSYIRSTLKSVKSVFTNYNEMVNENEKINIKTAQSKVDYDTRKLLKYFPDDMLVQILSNKDCKMLDYNKKLNLAIADYGKKNKLLDNLLIKIPRVDIKDSLNEDDFLQLLNLIAPYFRKNIKYLEDNMPDSIGYISYLMSTPVSSLTGENKERYNLIKEMLM